MNELQNMLLPLIKWKIKKKFNTNYDNVFVNNWRTVGVEDPTIVAFVSFDNWPKEEETHTDIININQQDLLNYKNQLSQ